MTAPEVDTEAIREAAEKATSGPWVVATRGRHVRPEAQKHRDWSVCQPVTVKDAKYIATMDPPTTLALLDALDEARAAIDTAVAERLAGVQAMLDDWDAWDGSRDYEWPSSHKDRERLRSALATVKEASE